MTTDRYPPGIPYATQRPAWGPYVRIPMYPDDADKGYWNTRLMRPAYSRYWLNRNGTRWFDPVGEALRTPYVAQRKDGPHPGGWWVARPHATPQYHRTGFLQTAAPGPLDVQRMQSMSVNYSGLRGAFSRFTSLFTGN